MPELNCPGTDKLFDYTVGRLSGDDSEVLAAHLDGCPNCQSVLLTFNDVEDPLVARLRSPCADDPLLAEPQCDEALVRAKAVAGRTSAHDPAPLSLPAQLGEYRLLETLGHGGMGAVFKALHTKLDRVVALKVLAGGRVEDEHAIVRFEREMKAVGRLDHPHIVRAYDARMVLLERPCLN